MDGDNLDFSFNMQGIDRRTLLEEAARELDALRGHLGDGSAGVLETQEGELVRSLSEDVARFDGFPVVYKVTDKDFLARNLAVPFRYQELTKFYKFYWLRFPILLFPQRKWAFNRLELRLQLSADNSPAYAQPKAYQILPSKMIQALLEAKTSLEVSLDGNFEFSAKTATLSANLGTAEVTAGAGAGAKVEGGVGLILGPFAFRLKKTVIDHTPIGLQHVFWRIDKGEFFEQDDLQLIVIVQLPKETRELQVAAVMQAYRYLSFAPAWLQQAIKQTSEEKRNFFKNGAPIEDKTAWDITPLLKKLDRRRRF